MKVAVAQINPIIGDLKYNTRKITGMIKKAAENDAELIIFPEMAKSSIRQLFDRCWQQWSTAALMPSERRCSAIFPV